MSRLEKTSRCTPIELRFSEVATCTSRLDLNCGVLQPLGWLQLWTVTALRCVLINSPHSDSGSQQAESHRPRVSSVCRRARDSTELIEWVDWAPRSPAHVCVLPQVPARTVRYSLRHVHPRRGFAGPITRCRATMIRLECLQNKAMRRGLSSDAEPTCGCREPREYLQAGDDQDELSSSG